MTRHLLATSAAALVFCMGAARAEVTAEAVVGTYADIAAAGYADSLTTAQALQQAVAALIAQPSDETLAAARAAWQAATDPAEKKRLMAEIARIELAHNIAAEARRKFLA